MCASQHSHSQHRMQYTLIPHERLSYEYVCERMYVHLDTRDLLNVSTYTHANDYHQPLLIRKSVVVCVHVSVCIHSIMFDVETLNKLNRLFAVVSLH